MYVSRLGTGSKRSQALGVASTASGSTPSGEICFVWKNGDAYQVEITDYH